jgi:UDP-N-acetyl-D-mannosaminuronate dehydrogenase
VILIDVETPVDEHNVPRYHALRDVLVSLGPVLKKGALVIVESTIAPGTMQDLVLPLLTREQRLKLERRLLPGQLPGTRDAG